MKYQLFPCSLCKIVSRQFSLSKHFKVVFRPSTRSHTLSAQAIMYNSNLMRSHEIVLQLSAESRFYQMYHSEKNIFLIWLNRYNKIVTLQCTLQYKANQFLCCYNKSKWTSIMNEQIIRLQKRGKLLLSVLVNIQPGWHLGILPSRCRAASVQNVGSAATHKL